MNRTTNKKKTKIPSITAPPTVVDTIAAAAPVFGTSSPCCRKREKTHCKNSLF